MFQSYLQLHLCKWENCGYQFEDIYLLQSHIESDHIGYKRNNSFDGDCKWAGCSSRKNARADLKTHIKSHLDVRPYSCPFCMKSFKWKQDKLKHRAKHQKLIDAMEILFENLPDFPDY
eukprot:NODE_38_length_35257_cov_0.939047.p29 type:complete len:118 gc:universal NODE_38_length_35257_cov_0.939047:20603-20956(+)